MRQPSPLSLKLISCVYLQVVKSSPIKFLKCVIIKLRIQAGCFSVFGVFGGWVGDFALI